ncbi:MAG TPA: biotin/lipoyl-binding protein [Candidatus Nanopelagicaceae bacterium]|nr:biotin/lipoyl-binding protein [Candidatus Nanopelagicaceae bacterium]
MRKATLAINGVLILALAGGGYYAYNKINPPVAAAAIRTVTAAMGTVTSSVSASGSLTSPGDMGLIFPSNGVLTSIRVAVGDHVKRGQLLATIDSTNATTALAQAQLSYRNALESITASKQNIETAQSNLDTAKTNAQTNLTNAQTNLATVQQALANTQAVLANNAIQYQNTLDQTQQDFVSAQQNFDLWNNNYQLSIPLCTVDTPPTGCSSWTSAYNSLQNAQRASENATLTNKANVLRDAQTLQSAENSVTSAQNAVTSAEAGFTFTSYESSLKSAQQAYADLLPGTTSATSLTSSEVARLAVVAAQKNLANTKMLAPAAGTVAAVGGKVGDISSPTSAGGINGFIVLTDVSAFQVEAGFSEADSVSVAVNAPATFTFDALANVTAQGTVLSIAPLPVSANSVNTYTVTFALGAPVKGLLPGMTANATVIVGAKSNVLTVSNSALNTRGGRTTVTVLSKGVQQQVNVTVGLKGDTDTEITSGLKAGEVLVLPASIAASSGFPGGGVPGASTGTLGGGGLGGGGFGGGGGARVGG